MISSRIVNRWQATLALLGCLGAASAWGQDQPNQTLDQVDAFNATKVLEMAFDQPPPTPESSELTLGSTGLAACKLASSGLYCLANGSGSQVVRQWKLPLAGLNGSPVDRISCAVLSLDGNTCTGLTVDLSGAIWVAGKKGTDYSLIKLVKNPSPAVPNGCATGSSIDTDWVPVTVPAGSTPLCARRFATGAGALSDLDAVDGEVAYPPALPIGPGILALNATSGAVLYFDPTISDQAPRAFGNWGLDAAAGERLLSTTLLQRKNAQSQVIGNYILAATTTRRILSRDVASPAAVTWVATISQPPPTTTLANSYGIRSSFKTGRAYVSDRNARLVRAFAPNDGTSFSALNEVQTRSTGDNAPDGLTVAPGNSVDLSKCATSTPCTVIPGAPGQPPSVTFDQVKLKDGSPSGVTVYQIKGLIDCRYAPKDCSDLLGVAPIGTAPFDNNEYMEGLIGEGIIIPLDPSKPSLAKNRYRPAAQLLNVTPMLPEDVTALFSESGGLPPLQISRVYRAQRGTDLAKPFRFDALFYRTAKDQVFVDTLFTDIEVGQLSSTSLGCNEGSISYGNLLKLDVATRVSESYRSISDFFRAVPNDYRDTIINDGCGGTRGQAPSLSLIPINLQFAPDTYGPQSTSNTQSVTENNDAVFARLVESLYDDLNRSRSQLACTTIDDPTANAAPLPATVCSDLASKWSTGKTLLNSCVSAAFSGATTNCDKFLVQLTAYRNALPQALSLTSPDPANRLGEQKARVATLTRIFNERFVPSILPKGWCREKTAPSGYKGCPAPAW